MQERKSCFFIGHRDSSGEIYFALADAVERHIKEYGVTDYFVGHYGRFDSMAARAVLSEKKRHPEVTLTLLLPYPPFGRSFPTPEGFDGTFYPPGMESVPKRLAIIRANQYMVCSSTHLIAYVSHPSGGSRDIFELALKRQRHGFIKVTNLSGWYPVL